MSKSSFEPEVSSKVDVAPATMRAAVYRGVNDVRVETIPVPEIGAGEVLVKIHTCGICGTDLKKIHTGSHDAPRVFGHEMAGTIVRVGEGVTGFAVGDRVMAYHHIDRKSTRLNSSHRCISYAVFCLKKKKQAT